MFPAMFPSMVMVISSLFAMKTDSDKMLQILREADASALSEYFNPSIQLSTPGKQGVYSRSQAKMILSEFFNGNKPSAAKLKSAGNNDNGAQFMMIDLVTGNGTFKINLSYRGSGENLRIHELKIEK